MDHFERELSRLMRDGQREAPYEERHRARLRAGVRARRRARRVWMATGSVLTAAGVAVGLLLAAGPFAQGGSGGPRPRPVTSTESAPMPSTVRPGASAQGVPLPTPASRAAG
ncbi:hypothetical protein [Streptomyces flavalbus]|uniref:Cellulase n=1 Tax=Streptomyces flavalbus TaxID=2665155 RepID=A0ABW2WE36_9ACTN